MPLCIVVDSKRAPYGLQVTSSGKVRRANDYKFFTEFQSHETEFDYLKSLEIEEKINAIKWCPRANGALFLLSTNGEPFASCHGFCSISSRLLASCSSLQPTCRY